MKRTLIPSLPKDTPKEILLLTEGADIYDSSCSPEAKVYFIDGGEGYYLKRALTGSLRREAEMNAYFHKKNMGPEVLSYVTEECDWLLCARVRGEDCTHEDYLSDPMRLSALLGEKLRELHELDASDCPVKDRTAEYLETAERNYRSGNYDKSAFPDSFGYRSAEEAYSVLSEGRAALRSDTLIHGDYCLPNVMLDGWRFSSFIDLGGGGVADRHIDLFWGSWTLWFNLGTNAYRDRFFDAYGRDKIDLSMLRIVAAAEVFG